MKRDYSFPDVESRSLSWTGKMHVMEGNVARKYVLMPAREIRSNAVQASEDTLEELTWNSNFERKLMDCIIKLYVQCI